VAGGRIDTRGAEAFRLFDKLLRAVGSFRDGVREYRSFWNAGIKASAMFAARSYSTVIGPMMSCLTPDVIPEPSRRALLIFVLEHVELFFSIARSPTAQWGGIKNVTRELLDIARVLSDAVRSAFSGQAFKAGGDTDMDFYKLHMMLPEHLEHFLSLFGPLWDTTCSTAESCGRLLKRLFLSTNRHDRDLPTQLVTRYLEQFFLRTILPRVTVAAAANVPAAPGAGPPVNRSALHGALPKAPIDFATLAAAWSSLRASLPSIGSLQQSTPAWFSECAITRFAPWKKVCDLRVSEKHAVLQYLPLAGVAGPRLVHDHTLQPVARALLLRPLAFFSANGAEFCVAHRYAPLVVETPRSLEFTLHKPRALDRTRVVIVPITELSHPLRVRLRALQHPAPTYAP
jgi:hypothetical protein